MQGLDPATQAGMPYGRLYRGMSSIPAHPARQIHYVSQNKKPGFCRVSLNVV